MADPKLVKDGIKRRKQIARFVDRHWSKYGYAPSYREIAEHCGISPTAVRFQVNVLVEEGELVRSSGHRTLRRP